MDHRFVRDKFIDLIDDTLPEEERKALEKHLSECEHCKKEFDEYRSVVKLEEMVAADYPSLDEDLSYSVMESVTYETVYENVYKEVYGQARWLVGSLVSVNLVMVGVLFFLAQRTGAPPPSQITLSTPPVTQSFMKRVADRNPAFQAAVPRLPVGYATVTFTLNSLEKLGELALPDSYVDVHCTYGAEGNRQTTTIGRLLKVLSVRSSQDFEAESDSKVMLTVIASEEDAERIELLRVLGDLQLSLYQLSREPVDTQPQLMTIYDPQGRPIPREVTPQAAMVMYERDQKSDKYDRYIREGNGWKKDPGIKFIAF